MAIGKKLEELLEKSNRNVNDLSLATGVKASTIYSMIKRDNTKADLDDLQAIADELGVTLDYFLSEPKMQKEEIDEEPDGDIRMIARARRDMTVEDQKKMMRVLKAAFEEFFKDEQ